MAKSGKKLVYDISFITNIDSIAKQLKSDVGNIKINFPTSNLKANEYIRSLGSSIKNFDNEYKNMIKNISQPNVSSKQIVGFISGFKGTIDATRTSLQSFKSSLNNTFKAADNQTMIASLKELEKQLEKVRKAGQSIGELRQQKVDISKQVSGFMGKPMPYSKLEATLTRYNKLSAQSTDGKMKASDRQWMDSISPSIEQLGAYKVQIDKVQAEIEKQVSGIKDTTGGVIAKGTKEEFGIATAQILNQMKEISSTIISKDAFDEISKNASGALNTAKQFGREYDVLGDKAASSLQQQEQSFRDVEEAAQSFKSILAELGLVFSAAWAVRQIKNLATASFNFYQSLDRALTEISVVSDLSRSQVQGLTSDFIQLSKQTGMAIDDIAKASVIFFQQGLNTEDVLTMTKVTADFAKVAGVTVEDAADKLTAAVNGFQIGVENAESVADKLNAVAAKSAASINELSTAFEKAASMANQAGISMDNYLAYIATMVEVTREAPENIGTSLKTIIARFQQVKEAGSSEDGETDVNQVETALKSVGIALRDDNNQLRDLQDVLAELGPLWNSLDRNTQAYLGTTIAGTRQQSRLIALMQHWDRAIELSSVSQESAGMQALMHKKAMEGLDATINRLTNSWQKFLATLTNSDMFIGILNSATNILDTFSSNGSKSILIFTAIGLAFGKIGKMLGIFAEKLIQSRKGFESLKNNTKENTQLLEAYENQIREIKAQMDALQVTMQKESNNQIGITTKLDAGGLSKSNQNELRRQLEASKMAVSSANEEFVKLSEKQLLATEASTKLKQAQIDVKEAAVNSSIAISTTVVGVVMAFVTAIGQLDSSAGQAAIGITALAGAVAVAFKIMDAGLKSAGVIGLIAQAVALAITGITALFSAFQTEASKTAKAIEEANTKLSDLNESIKASGAALRSVDSNLKTYDELSKKIALTAEEQQKLNDAVKALADYYSLVVTQDASGNYVIDMKKVAELREKDASKMKDEQEELIKTSKEQMSNYIKQMEKDLEGLTYTRPIKSEGKNYYTYTEKGKKRGLSLQTEEKDLEKFYANERQSGVEKILNNLREDFLQNTGSINQNSANAVTQDGAIVASSATRTGLDTKLRETLYANAEEKILRDLKSGKYSDKDGKINANKVADAINKNYLELVDSYQQIFSNETPEGTSRLYDGEKMFDDISIRAEELTKEIGDSSFDTISQATNEFFTGISDRMGVDEDSSTIKEMKESFIKTLYSSAEYGLPELVKKYKGTQLEGTVKQLGQTSATRLNSFGMFDEGNEQLLTAISPQLLAIDEAYKESGSKGAVTMYKALDDALNDPNASETVKATAEKAMQKVMDSMSLSAGKTWSQVTEELDSATDSLRTMNELAASLAENGGWTLDEFTKFASVLDSINLDNLNPDALSQYTSALDQLQLGFDATTGSITANGDAVNALQQIQATAAKATIQQSINTLKAKDADITAQIAMIDAEVATNQGLIEYLKANAQEDISIKKLQTKAETDFATNKDVAAGKIANIYETMTGDSGKWAKASITAIAAVGKAMNQLVTNKAVDEASLQKQVTSAINSVSWGGMKGIDWSGIKVTDTGNVDINSAISSLESYNAKVKNTKSSLEAQRKTIQQQIGLLTQLSTADLTKLGTKGAKEVEAYVKQLTEMLNILKQIERLDHRLTILGDYEGLAIGKQYTQVLLAQLDVVGQQKTKYKQLYDMQKNYVNSLAQNLLSGKYGKLVSFLADGTIQYDDAKYNKLSDKQAEEFDKLYDNYDKAFKDLIGYHETAMQYWKQEIDIMQQRVDAYTDAENQILDAVKKREKDILDTKLDAVDKEIEAINKAAEARKKAREDEDSAKEISKLQTDLQRALMDTSAGSATRVLEIQDQIKQKQQEMADGSFDRMVDDEVQAREDQKTAEQDAFDERLENMDYYWSEVEKIMTSGTESIIETLKTYSEDYIQASDAEQTEIVNGWSDTFSRIADLGKTKVAELQNTILNLKKSLDTSDWDSILSDATRSTQQTYTEPVAATAPSLSVGSYISVKPGTKWYSDSYGGGRSGNARAGKIKYVNSRGSYGYNIEGLGWVKKSDIVGYNTGGLNTSTGLAMLHGTTSQPEAVLNALQTKTFIKFTSALDNLTAQGSAVGSGLGSSVNIESIKFQVDNMSSEEDGRKAFTAFVDRFNEIGKQKGLSVRLPN